MRDGFYLSTYLSPPGLSWLLGVWPRHDNNISLWRKRGKRLTLERHWELERLSGFKQHGAAFASTEDAHRFISALLKAEGLSLSEIVEIWGTPGLETGKPYGIMGTGVPFHGIAHLYTALMMDSEQFYSGKTLALAVDGVPDFMIERTHYYYAGAYVECGRTSYFAIESPGRIYDSASERFGRRAGTLMALANASTARIGDAIEPLMEGLEFWGDKVAQAGGHSAITAADELVDRVVHRVTSSSEKSREDLGFDGGMSDEENFASMAMKLLQEACLRVMERNIDRAILRFGIRPDDTWLALSGGFALNCPSNVHLIRKYGFQRLLAPPCVNDSGQSIGIALATFFDRCSADRLEFQFPGAFAGPEAREEDLTVALDTYRSHIESCSAWHAERFVKDVRSAPVIWFDGASEMGPRALGHRSLIGDPTLLAMKQELNRIKKREWWRPVAPIVLEQCLHEWFESAAPSPYMLQTFRIKPDRAERVIAVAHMDSSARVQTLREDQDPRLYNALTEFHRRTGVPLLCNTSLNDKGEPIINTVQEAINFAIRKKVAVAYFFGRRVQFVSCDTSPWDAPLQRHRVPFVLPPLSSFHEACQALNPHGLEPVELFLYLTTPKLRKTFDLENPADCLNLKNAIDELFASDSELLLSTQKYLSRVWRTHRPPCQDFQQHPWSDTMTFLPSTIREARSY